MGIMNINDENNLENTLIRHYPLFDKLSAGSRAEVLRAFKKT